MTPVYVRLYRKPMLADDIPKVWREGGHESRCVMRICSVEPDR